MMDLKALTDMIMTQGAFATLFIWLLIDTNKKNEIREQRMQEQLNKTIPILNQIALRLDDIEDKIKI
ncbi:BhlA/UviB family holin-like peptide [Romboutsia ilealis]|nr:BhlA/UviB family holin-like peptide [Romboutsia ilealis]